MAYIPYIYRIYGVFFNKCDELDQIRSDIHTQKHTMKPQESRAKIVPPYTISASLRGREPHSCLHSSQTPLRGIPSPSGDRGQGRLPPRIGRGAKTTQARRADNSDLDRTREGALRLITLALRLVACLISPHSRCVFRVLALTLRREVGAHPSAARVTTR